ncbi:hypothetical protein XO10_01355 [Marinitoga sp. 1135]|uniref:MFS transporter n=1 Tax=unclassified Marinitoga TaxID=2640159 RepID=UPI000950A6A4|nr:MULTISPECIES: MFS transporter [unclassified Marinitoga]APT75178.1 hypothetical protein LN42_01270 [Marinitoga sp. 1137]NUU94952.1 hypothetical protein [Marinitoga sp. 1135]NUU96921.1 hypothetical protein [Marinitoga sp. 1138]
MSKEVLNNKNYVLIIISDSINRFGDSIDKIVYPWMVYEVTNSTSIMGILFAINFIPQIIFTILGSNFIDFYSKKKIVISGNLLRGIIVFFTAILLLTKTINVSYIFLFSILSSSLGTIVKPANKALIPLVVEKNNLMEAISFSNLLISIVDISGLLFGGLISSYFNMFIAFIINSLTFFISSVLLAYIRINEIFEKNISKNKFLIFDTLNYIRKNKIIFPSILMAFIVNLCITPFYILQVVYVKDILNQNSIYISYMEISTLSGIIIGSYIISKISKKIKNLNTIVVSIIFLSITYALYVLPQIIIVENYNLFIYIVFISFFFGFFGPFSTIPLNYYIQAYSPKNMLGRINLLKSFLARSSAPLAGLIVSIISNKTDILSIFLIMSSIMGISAIIFYLKNYKTFNQVKKIVKESV